MNNINPCELSIIAPSFQESENIAILIDEISTILGSIVLSWEIIIVDDNSNDGTIEICEKLILEGIPLKLIVRKDEKGLATAVLKGLTQANGSVFIVMDADLSHPPECIPLLYQSVLNGSEFSVGSRYIQGGDTDDKWTVYRFLNSKLATILAKPLTNINDPMSGFFALPRYVWERGQAIDPIGYKIGLELIVKCRPSRIEEIPIYFRSRRLGKSKLTIRQQLLYLFHLMKLYRYKLTLNRKSYNP
jgi:dolichol-phosphate mannosyltransferase